MTPPDQKTDSVRGFTACLAALFLAVLGSELWLAQLYGSPLPLWDQWWEANNFLRPWMGGTLTWQAFFEPANGHRIFSTRLVDFLVVELNGRWEPLLLMTVNVFIHAVFAVGLAFCLWRVLGRRHGQLICFLLLPFFALPYGGENVIWAITLEYFLDIFCLATVVALGFTRPGSVWWWAGLVVAVMGLFTMATGLLAPVAVGGLAVLRILKERRLSRGNLFTLAASVAIVGLGLSLSAGTEEHQLQAQNAGQFATAVVNNLTWVFYDSRVLGGLIWLPLVLLVIVYFRKDFPAPRAAELLLTLALWSGLQAAALAYGRANYGDGFPVSRYLDFLNVFVIASLFATMLLAQFWLRGTFTGKLALLPSLVFAALIFFGLARISEIVVEQLLQPTRMMNLIAEERVEKFMTTGNERDLLEQPTVRPDTKVTLAVLRDPNLQSILPASCLPPNQARVTGRFSFISQWLLRHSPGLLYAGLFLLIGLIAWQLIRSPLGLALENIPLLVALLTLLVALGFVWSRSAITRRTLEYDLQRQLVDYFQANNNPQRAAIHAAKADALKADAGPSQP